MSCIRKHFMTYLAGCILLHTPALMAQLTVSRVDGSVSLSTPDSVELKGYSINSPGGLLDPDAWSSLSGQGLDGWSEANPRDVQLSELNPLGSSDPSAGFSLGNAYTGTTLGLAAEDVSFQYVLGDGSVVDGSVDYEGPINDFVLRVDPTSGAANLELLSANVGPFDVVGFSIFSDSGSLVPGNATPISADWTVAAPMETAVAQLQLQGSTLFETNSSVTLGNVFDPSGTQDLRFEFATSDKQLLTGSVFYGAGEVSTCDPNSMGDLDGNGTVEFADFLILSGNFGMAVADHTEGDIDCNGSVEFGDFLVLSANFGQMVGAAAVPEPEFGWTTLFGLLMLGGVSRMRRKSNAVLCGVLVTCMASALWSPSSAMAVDFNTRMIVLDPENPGPNNQINSAREARGIFNGTVTDVNILEDVTGTVDVIDFAGGAGQFTEDNLPYPNGVNDATQNDFAVRVTGFLEIPAGAWTIGLNSDDGGYIDLPRVTFEEKVNENGSLDIPGELIYNGTRGQGTWTLGMFTVPEGETLRTEFEALMFERGGGDSFEVGILEEFALDNSEMTEFGFPLLDGELGWQVTETGPAAGDFNWDDSVSFDDFVILAENFGTGSKFAQGDMNGDNMVDLQDFAAFYPLLTPAAAAVPEPSAATMIGLAAFGFLPLLRRKR